MSDRCGAWGFFNRPAVFAAAALVALTVTVANTWVRVASIRAVTELGAAKNAKPVFDYSSATGYAGGVRRIVMPSGCDGCHWMMNAQGILAGEGLRPRWTSRDNAPHGREIHWSSSVAWWLAALALPVAWAAGIPRGAAVEEAGLWGMAVLHCLLIVGVPLLFRRPFGWLGAAALALGMGCSYAFSSGFFAGAPDHHGLAVTFLLATVLSLAAGLLGGGGPGASQSGRWFAAAGFFAGGAMWVSAATAIPALAGMAAGALAASLPDRRAGVAPGCWRLFGFAAFLSSLAFYALEYFPSHMAMRLEVNHPAYAIALLGMGELLARFALWLRGAPPWRNARSIVACSLALGAVAAPMLCVLLLGRPVFKLNDPFLWRLHAEFIHEFLPLFTWASRQHPQALLVYLTPVPLLLIPMILLAADRRLPGRWRSAFFISAAPALVLTVLGFSQVRWMNAAGALWLAPLAVCMAFAAVEPAARGRRFLQVVLAAVCVTLSLPMTVRVALDFADYMATGPKLVASDFDALYAREIAYRLRAQSPVQDPIVVAGPTVSTWLAYFGGFRVVGTLYWENLEGLKAAAGVLAAETDKGAREKIAAAGVDYLAMFSYEPFADEYLVLKTGQQGAKASSTFGSRILEMRWPSWATPVPMPSPRERPQLWAIVLDCSAVHAQR